MLRRGLFEVDARLCGGKQAECDRYLGKQKVGLLENGPMEMQHVFQTLAVKVLTLDQSQNSDSKSVFEIF